MAEIVAIRSINDEVNRIHRKWSTLDGQAKKTTDLRLSLAMDLRELKERVEAGEDGDEAALDWWERYGARFARSRSDAADLLRLAGAVDPVAAIEKRREQKRTSAQKQKLQVVNSPTSGLPSMDSSPQVGRSEMAQPTKTIKPPAKSYPSDPGDDNLITLIMEAWRKLSWDGRVRLWQKMQEQFNRWRKGEE